MNLKSSGTLLLILASSLSAGTLVVSGDSNIGNGIDGSGGSIVVAGNRTFFSNLLGGGTNIVFQTTTNSDVGTEGTSENAIINYYGTTLGRTVTQVSTVTSANLSSANLLISFLQDVAYTGAEMSAIQGFLNSGGTVLVTAEYVGFDPTSIANVNALLTFLGSSMSLGSNSIDLGFRTAAGAQINATPFTAGVTSFEYAATTNVVGGTSIFRTSDLQNTFMAYTSTSSTTPEPGTAGLVVVGAALAWGIRRHLTR